MQSVMLTTDMSGQSGCTVHGLSALFPRLNCGFASALCSRMLAHGEEPGLVDLPRHVCPGDQTGPISTSSSVARQGPMHGVVVSSSPDGGRTYRLCRLLFSCWLVRLSCG